MEGSLSDHDEAQARPKTKRSKNGCVHCRTRRIKCDEKQPVCGRCLSLQLDCYRPKPKPPLHLRRRGYGSIKSRSDWRPQAILPDTLEVFPSSSDSASSGADVDGPTQFDILQLDPSLSSATEPLVEDILLPTIPTIFDQPNGVPTTESGFLTSIDGAVAECEDVGHKSNGPWMNLLLNFPNMIYDQTGFGAQDTWSGELVRTDAASPQDALGSALSPSERAFSMAAYQQHYNLLETTCLTGQPSYGLEHALGLEPDEKRALMHYRSRFVATRTVKGFPWSAYSLFLRNAIGNKVTLHLILALSLRNMWASNTGKGGAQLTKQHLQKGLELLQQAIVHDNSDLLTILTSFWLLNLFESECNDEQCVIQRQELSSRLREYVHAQGLDEFHETGSEEHTTRIHTASKADPATWSLIFKLLSMLIYADVQSDFVRGTSALAESFLSGGRMFNMRRIARNYLQLNHGEEYPSTEVVHDIETNQCFEAFHEVHRIYHAINQLFWRDTGDTAGIRRDIDSFKVAFSSFFQIAQSDTVDSGEYSRLQFFIDAAVGEFYALNLYYLWCTDDDFSEYPAQSHLSAYLKLAHRLERSSVRFSWFDRSLFVAGVETSDPIHKDWLQRRMMRTSWRSALQRVWHDRSGLKRRLTRRELQGILGDAAA